MSLLTELAFHCVLVFYKYASPTGFAKSDGSDTGPAMKYPNISKSFATCPLSFFAFFVAFARNQKRLSIAPSVRFFAVFGGIGSQLCGSRSLPAMR
jgi:hypothetical protein